MTVVRFDGANDNIIFPIGAFNGMAGGPITLVCLYRTDNLAITRTLLEFGLSGGGRVGLGVSSGDLFRFFNGSSTRDGPTTPSGWFLGVTTKTSGTTIPRYHIYDLTAGTWSHGAQGTSTANQTLGNGEVRFGESLAAAQDCNGDIGLGALANVALSDAEVEAMTTNRKTSDIWAALAAATIVDLYELTSASAITSLGGSTETSRTGTTTVAESIPGGWSFDGAGAITVAIGQALETDTAQALGRAKLKLLGQVTESETAQALGRRETRLLGQALETDLAQALTWAPKIRLLGQVLETDTAQSLTKRKVRGLVAATESDVGQALGSVRRRTLVAALETDTAQLLGRLEKRLLGGAQETDVGQALARLKRKLLVSALQSDTAQTLNVGGSPLHPITQAQETDTAQALAKAERKVITAALETDLAQALGRAKRQAIAVAAELDVGQVLQRQKARSIGLVVETDSAIAVGRLKVKTLVQATEIDSAQILLSPVRRSIGLAVELELALALARGTGPAVAADIVLLALLRDELQLRGEPLTELILAASLRDEEDALATPAAELMLAASLRDELD